MSREETRLANRLSALDLRIRYLEDRVLLLEGRIRARLKEEAQTRKDDLYFAKTRKEQDAKFE